MRTPISKRSFPQRLAASLTNPIGDTAIRPYHLLLADILLVLLSYGLFLRMHFSVDSYRNIYDPSIHQYVYTAAGRPVSAAIIAFLENLLHIHGVFSQPLYTLCLMGAVVLFVWRLSLMILKELGQPSPLQILVVQAAMLLSLVNVYFMDWFMYAECSNLMAVAVLLTLCAVRCLLLKNQIWATVCSFLFLILATNVYQVYFELYVVFALLLVLVRHRFTLTRQAFFQCLRVLLLALAAIAVTLVITKILENFVDAMDSRHATSSAKKIMENLKAIYHYQPTLWIDSYGLLPRFSTLGVFLALVGCLGYTGLKENKQNLSRVLLTLLAFCLCYGVLFAPHIVAGGLWMPERTFLVFFSLFTLLAVAVVTLSKRVVIHKIVAVLIVCYLALNIWAVQNIAMDQFITMALDKEYALHVNRAIQTYEEEQGITVANIAAVCDAEPTTYYSDYIRFYTHDTNKSAKSLDWCISYALNYYASHRFTITDMDPKVYQAYFEGQNWDAYAPEQVVIQGDTAYVCTY